MSGVASDLLLRPAKPLATRIVMFLSALQKTIAPAAQMGWAEAIVVSIAALAAAIPAVAALYVVKSALGINLMAGPSPLHDLLYSFAR